MKIGPSVHRNSISSAIIRTIRVIRVPFLLPDSNTEAVSIRQMDFGQNNVKKYYKSSLNGLKE